jgi:predicted PurR-regulated permease PerM
MIQVIKKWFHRYFSDPQAVLLAILLLVSFTVLMTMSQMLAPVLVSVAIAYLLEGLIQGLQQWRVPRSIAIFFVYSTFVALLCFIVVILLPLLTAQLNGLVKNLPSYVEKGHQLLQALPEKYPKLISKEQIDEAPPEDEQKLSSKEQGTSVKIVYQQRPPDPPLSNGELPQTLVFYLPASSQVDDAQETPKPKEQVDDAQEAPKPKEQVNDAQEAPKPKAQVDETQAEEEPKPKEQVDEAQEYPKLISKKQIDDMIGLIRSKVKDISQTILSYSLASIPIVITLVVYSVLVPLLVFFFLKDKEKIFNWLVGFLPKEHSVAQQIWMEMDAQIGNYIRGKVYEIFLVGTFTYFAFAYLGLNYAPLLAVLVGLSVIIPYVGAVVVTFPVIIVAYFQWGVGPDFLWAVGAYLVIQALDGNVLVPLLFSEAVNLHPVAIIVAVLVFGGFWGFWGVFFAIPLATLVKALLSAWPRTQAEE